MRVAAPHRVVAACTVAVSLAAAVYLADAQRDASALREAERALARGDLRTALRQAAEAGDGATTEGRAAAIAARARFRAGDIVGGTTMLSRAVAARPNDWVLRRDLAVAYAVGGRPDRARRQALRALMLNPRATLPSGFNVRPGGR